MTRRWLLVAPAVVAAAVAVPLVVRALTTAPVECTAPAVAGGGNASGPVNTSPSGAAYWTPERMRSASAEPQRERC